MARFTHDLLVLGGGAGGLTIASGCAQLGVKVALIEKERLGSRVTLFDAAPRILPREDEDISELMARQLASEGAAVHTGAKIERIEATPSGKRVHYTDQIGRAAIAEGDEVLVAIGRMGSADSLSPANVGLETDRGFLPVGPNLTTARKSIMAVGDGRSD